MNKITTEKSTHTREDGSTAYAFRLELNGKILASSHNFNTPARRDAEMSRAKDAIPKSPQSLNVFGEIPSSLSDIRI